MKKFIIIIYNGLNKKLIGDNKLKKKYEKSLFRGILIDKKIFDE